MATVRRGPPKQPGERWLGEGIVGLIPFGPRPASSSERQSDKSESESQDPMAPAAEALERWMVNRLKEAGVTDSEDESTSGAGVSND